MAKDKEYMRLIGTGRWRKLRAAILSVHPLCADCESRGVIRLASEVHHVTPVETAINLAGKTSLMFDAGNLRPLCHECHVAAHTEMGRSGKELTAKRNRQKTDEVINRFFGGVEG